MTGHGDIRTLVRRLQGSSEAEQAQAASAIFQMMAPNSGRREAIAAAVAAEGGIPAVLQLIRSPGEHPEAAPACLLLSRLTFNSPARCQAVIAAAGIAPLVRCLESSSNAYVQADAASTLAHIAGYGGEAGAAAVVAAGAIPAAIRRLVSSSSCTVLKHAATVLGNLATSTERRHAITTAGAISPLVRLLRHRSPEAVASANALGNLMLSMHSIPHIEAIAEAGGIPPLVQLLAASSDVGTVEAAATAVRNMLCFGPVTTAAKVIEAGGIPALVRCLQGQRTTSTTHKWAAHSLDVLASTGDQASRAIAAAGGIRALLQALARPCSAEVKAAVAHALRSLVLLGQAAAVAAADSTNAVAPALEWLDSSPADPDSLSEHAEVTEALRLLAAARVCAAPGCGATAGLKRCAGCGSVRYCSEACMRAHWREHRPECKRLRAAAAAAAGGAGPSSSGQP